MSWIERISNPLIVKTGDSKSYTILWKNATRSREYNVAEFEFPEVDGTLVKRSRPKGMRYNIEFYFQGEDNIDNAEAFKVSADDSRAWTLSHPLYDNIIVQPLNLVFDNTAHNVTKVTGTVVETITEDRPKTSQDPVDKIAADKIALDEAFATSFANDVQPNTVDKINLSSNVASAYNLGKKKVKLTVDAEAYFNAFNTANAAILDATSEPLAAMRAIQTVLNSPGYFADSVQNRISVLSDQVEALRVGIPGVLTTAAKRIFENNIASMISSMLYASSTPETDDYENRNDVVSVIETLIDNYNQYVTDLDSLQTENGGELDSYIPDADSFRSLNLLLNFTVSNLFTIALGSKQERSIILEDDSNVVLLTHRFYKLDDTTLEKFINTNQIGINEMLQIRKGRMIKYYV